MRPWPDFEIVTLLQFQTWYFINDSKRVLNDSKRAITARYEGVNRVTGCFFLWFRKACSWAGRGVTWRTWRNKDTKKLYYVCKDKSTKPINIYYNYVRQLISLLVTIFLQCENTLQHTTLLVSWHNLCLILFILSLGCVNVRNYGSVMFLLELSIAALLQGVQNY